MVQALVEIDETTNRALNVIRAKHGLKDKGEAIQYVVYEHIEMASEPELKPEFIKKIDRISRQRSIKVDDFAKRYGVTQ